MIQLMLYAAGKKARGSDMLLLATAVQKFTLTLAKRSTSP
jgi:hypothetical protein